MNMADKFKKAKDAFMEDDPLETPTNPTDHPPLASDLTDGTVPVYVPSAGLEYYTESLSGKTTKFLRVNVNGEELKVDCDRQVQIPVRFYDAVKGILERQRDK